MRRSVGRSIATLAMLWIAATSRVFGQNSVGASDEAPDIHHLSPVERARLDSALAKASVWLLARQGSDGAFRSGEDRGVPPVPLTAMALWALTESDRDGEHDAPARGAAEYLLRYQQEDGGIYDPSGGIVRFTASVANQALRAWDVRKRMPGMRDAIDRLELFVYRNRDVESLTDETARPSPGVSNARVEELRARDDLAERKRKAVEFLWRARQKPTDRPVRPTSDSTTETAIPYDDLLRYLGELTRRDNPTLSRAHFAIRNRYTVRGNPDLTSRYGPAGFQDEGAGYYYYLLTLARTLGGVGRVELETVDGRKHDWSREISDRLLALQASEGSWSNENARWWEDDPVLVSCYAMISLAICRDLRKEAPGRP